MIFVLFKNTNNYQNSTIYKKNTVNVTVTRITVIDVLTRIFVHFIA